MTRNMRIQTYRINRHVGKILTNAHVGLRRVYIIRQNYNTLHRQARENTQILQQIKFLPVKEERREHEKRLGNEDGEKERKGE